MSKTSFEDALIFALDRGAEYYFKSFLLLCEKLLELVDFDSTYILSNKYINGVKTHLIHKNSYGGNSKTLYGKQEINWDTQIKQPGESFMSISDKWFEQMYHAFNQYPQQI